MTDADTKSAPPADDSASDVEKTDEQLWDELGSKEADPDADDAKADDAEDIEDKADDADGADSPDEPDDPGASDDTDTGDGSDGPTDGKNLEALQVQKARLLKALESEKGRSAGGRREIQRLESQIASAPDTKAQSDDKDDAHLKEQREKLDASRAEYGDVIGPLTDEVTALKAQIAEDKEQKAREEARKLEQDKEHHRALVDAEIKVFKGEHPDGFETIAKHREVFDEWVDDQPRNLRDIYAENKLGIVDGTQAAYLVTRFKQALLGDPDGSAPANPETERLQGRRQRQLAGAISLRNSTGQAVTSRPAKDSDDLQGHWDSFRRQEQREER